MLRTGYQPAPMPSEDYARFAADDVAAMVKLGKETHIDPLD
jgi:hypothetical protein